MAASGRKLSFDLDDFSLSERPLLVKADNQPGTPEIGLPNVRYTLGSGHSAKLLLKGRL